MPDPADYAWRSRVLLVFAASASDAALAAQRQAVARASAGMAERDVVLLTSLGTDEPGDAALRGRYGVGAGFAALLIGKDGGVKLRSAHPIPPEILFPTVDAMPMRRSEMRGR